MRKLLVSSDLQRPFLGSVETLWRAKNELRIVGGTARKKSVGRVEAIRTVIDDRQTRILAIIFTDKNKLFTEKNRFYMFDVLCYSSKFSRLCKPCEFCNDLKNLKRELKRIDDILEEKIRLLNYTFVQKNYFFFSNISVVKIIRMNNETIFHSFITIDSIWTKTINHLKY